MCSDYVIGPGNTFQTYTFRITWMVEGLSSVFKLFLSSILYMYLLPYLASHYIGEVKVSIGQSRENKDARLWINDIVIHLRLSI